MGSSGPPGGGFCVPKILQERKQGLSMKRRLGAHQLRNGFTIVELLIVIVVIAILAAITIVAYNGIQNRAYDTSIQSDLRQISKQLDLYNVQNGSYPDSQAKLATMGVRVAKNAYGRNAVSGTATYNLLYCRPQSSDPSKYALVASSKSGTLFQFSDGSISSISRSTWDAPAPPSAGICTEAGVSASTPQIWGFLSGAWESWVGGS